MVYFLGTHTRSTVPRGRSAAALVADATVAQILIMLYMIRVGKGLKHISICNGAGYPEDRRFRGPRVLALVF